MKRALAILTLLGPLLIPVFSVVVMAGEESVLRRPIKTPEHLLHPARFPLTLPISPDGHRGRGIGKGGRGWGCRTSLWQDFIWIGEGFAIRNIRIEPHPEGVRIAGDILNLERGFFGFAFFKIQLFDKDGAYLGGNNFSISSFQRATVRPFQLIVPRVPAPVVDTYSIEFIP